MSYNPGTATTATKIAPGRYAIDSFRGEGSYLVDLNADTCSCPDAVRRGNICCKHKKVVRAHHAEELALKAETLTDAELTALLPKYEAAGRFDIALAVRGELFDRAAICARPPVGRSVKLYGPTSDAEAAATWR